MRDNQISATLTGQSLQNELDSNGTITIDSAGSDEQLYVSEMSIHVLTSASGSAQAFIAEKDSSNIIMEIDASSVNNDTRNPDPYPKLAKGNNLIAGVRNDSTGVVSFETGHYTEARQP